MKEKLMYASAASLGIAIALALFDLTAVKTSIDGSFQVNVNIYPATFFALLGALLIYHGLKPLWQK